MSDTLITAPATHDDARTEEIDQLPIAYFEMNARGVITCANLSACRIFQRPREEMVGKTPWEFMAPEDIEISQEAFFDLMRTGEEPTAIRRTLITQTGDFRTYELHRTVILDAEGHRAGLRYAAIDITEARIEHERAHRARMWLESVLASVGEAVIVTDALGFIRYVNPATVELSGWEAEEMVGKAVEKCLPVLSYASSSGDRTPLNFRMTVEKKWKGVVTVLDHGRNELKLEISTSPILDRERGYTIGVVSILRRMDAPV